MNPLLHHVALGAQDVEAVADFYTTFFGLHEVQRHHDKSLRSIWLQAGPTVLMVERTQRSNTSPQTLEIEAGPFLLVFGVSSKRSVALSRELEHAGYPIEASTDYTIYTRDPEGNRVGFSHYDFALRDS